MKICVNNVLIIFHGMKNYFKSFVVVGKKIFDLEQISFIKFERAYCFYDLYDSVVSVKYIVSVVHQIECMLLLFICVVK